MRVIYQRESNHKMLYCYWELLCWLNSIFPNFYFSCRFSSLKARDGRKKQVLTGKKWTYIAWLGSTVQPLCIKSNRNQYVYTDINLLPIRSERCRWCIWCMNEELLFPFSHITYEKLNIILPQSFFLLHFLFLLSEIIFLYSCPLKSLFQKPKENWVHLCIISLAIFASIPHVPGSLGICPSVHVARVKIYVLLGSCRSQLALGQKLFHFTQDQDSWLWVSWTTVSIPECLKHLRCIVIRTWHK